MIYATIALVKLFLSRLHSLWVQYQPALAHRTTRGDSDRTLLDWSPHPHVESDYSDYVAAVYDEVHRMCAHIQETQCHPTLLRRGRKYLIRTVEFQSDELWYHCAEPGAPFTDTVFHHEIDLVWHLLLTSMGEPRHPYFAKKMFP